MKYCTSCVTPDTRPRLEFDANGQCNACTWHERKQKEIDWVSRRRELETICDRFRRQGYWDVLIPCSGGKDGSYVAHRLKHEFGMHPLCVTFASPIPTQIGKRNLQNFLQCGYDHLMVTPDFEVYRRFNREAFIMMGMPKQAFVTGISTALLKIALKFDIKLVFYGEQGEVEYGGKQETESLQWFTPEFLKDIYYEGQDPSAYGYWWEMPTAQALEQVHMTWWSLFEDWDPEVHAKLAKDKCGLEMLVGGSIGTFTNYAQLDDAMQDLHTYLQYVKFGFGRCTSDASIEIRRGRMTREQGVAVVNKLDGTFPWEYLDAYLGYFQMSEENFWHVIRSFVNWDVLKVNPEKDDRPFVLREPCV